MKHIAWSLVLATAVLGGCGPHFQTAAPKTYTTYRIMQGEGLSDIALRNYDNSKTGFLYLREVNANRLRGKSGELTGTEIIVPSEEDFAEWLTQNEKELDKILPSAVKTAPSQ